MMLHKKNYRDELGNTTLGYTTLLGKMYRYSKSVQELPECMIGLGDGYRHVTVFPKEAVLEVCNKVLADLEKLPNKDNYTKPWERLKEFLEEEIEHNEEIKKMGVEYKAGDTLPEDFSKKFLQMKNEEAIFISINKDKIHVLCKLRKASSADKEEIAQKVDLTLYVDKHVPFLLLSYLSICFVAVISFEENIEEETPLVITIGEDRSNTILQHSSYRVSEAFISKVKNILRSSPFKTKDDLKKKADIIMHFLYKGEMVGLGQKIDIEEIKE
jgi:hypothetical protein